MKPSRIDRIRQVASEWEFDKRIPAPRAARLLRELLERVDELENVSEARTKTIDGLREVLGCEEGDLVESAKRLRAIALGSGG